jgi:NADPH2:quinone reductase
VTDPVPAAAPAVLIIGDSGGVGSIAIQLIRTRTDLTVIATASRRETQAWVTELAAHHVIDHNQPLAHQIEALGIGAPGFAFSTNDSEQYGAQVAELLAPKNRFGLIDDQQTFDIMPFKSECISTHSS